MATDGVRYVMTSGEERMLRLSAVSWDSSEVQLCVSLVGALVLYGWMMSSAGEKIGVYRNDYDCYRNKPFACKLIHIGN